MKTCKDCKFFVVDESIKYYSDPPGHCHRYPPTIHIHNAVPTQVGFYSVTGWEYTTSAAYPKVSKDFLGCGEYHDRERTN